MFMKYINENNSSTLIMAIYHFKVFYIVQGKRYRFRLINAGFLNCPITMSIDNHTFTMIATDGYNVQPVVGE